MEKIKGMENRQACCSQDGTFEQEVESSLTTHLLGRHWSSPFYRAVWTVDPRVILQAVESLATEDASLLTSKSRCGAQPRNVGWLCFLV